MVARPRSLPAALALAALAGCGLSPTGQPWSTKSRSVLSPDAEAAAVPPGAGLAAPPSDGGLRQRAVDLLLRAAGSEQALLRANAIEALHHAPRRLGPVVRRGLVDENRGVRFVSAMTIGELPMEGLAHLLEPLLGDPSASVRAAAIFGLYRNGHPVDLSPLAAMIGSGDPEVRANAALILGELGNPTALPMLRMAAGRGMERVAAARARMVDLQLAEAMVRLRADEEMEVIRAALFAPPEQGELTALACMMCGRLGDQRAIPDLVRLSRRTGRYRQAAEIRMAATWALALLDPAQALAEVPLSYVEHPQYQLRAQAALTLGQIGDPEALSALETMLGDRNPVVQVAAAGGILQILAPQATGGTAGRIDTNGG